MNRAMKALIIKATDSMSYGNSNQLNDDVVETVVLRPRLPMFQTINDYVSDLI